MASPIKHVVIIFKENHTFDNYFGAFPAADGDPHLSPAPDPPLSDHPHNRAAWINRATTAVRQSYGEKDIPQYWALARQFTLCDRYFTDVAGPSTPNHLMLITADSPLINNYHKSDASQPVPPYDLPSVPANLEKAGSDWRCYGGKWLFDMVTALKGSKKVLASAQFSTDAAAGKLAPLSYVYAPSGQDEHPVASVAKGAAWTAQQIDAIAKGGLWPSTAIFVTWDDWGGWYDHVDPPPSLEQWTDGYQFRLGNRVPCLVVSPYARTGYISHLQHSHVSLARFVEDTFGLVPINHRDGTTDGMTDCFDFTRQPAAPPNFTAPPGPAPGPTPTPTPTPGPTPAPPPGPGLSFTVVHTRAHANPYKFELRTADGNLVARSEGFASSAECVATIDFIRGAASAATIVGQTT